MADKQHVAKQLVDLRAELDELQQQRKKDFSDVEEVRCSQSCNNNNNNTLTSSQAIKTALSSELGTAVQSTRS